LSSITSTLAGIIQRQQINQEKHQLEKLLLQSQKIEALGTLSGGIAHDFNNLLAPILGYSEMALRDTEPNSRAEARIKEIVKAATRAKDLVKQILVMSHQNALPNQLIPLNLDRVIEEMLPLVRAAIPSTVDIRVKNKQPGCQVLADETQIQQILLNLCINAYHAMPENAGVITISLRQTRLNRNDLKIRSLGLLVGAYLVLEVSDNGCGMGPETLNRIFDPYFTTKKQGEGTGLGLSIVNGLVKSYGGMISVYSELERGSSFHIYLPCTDQAVFNANEQSREMPGGNEAILVVDDEPQVGKMTSETLELLGYRTTHCLTGSEAIQAFRQEPERFDLLITDMTMPKMTGVDLMTAMRKIRPNLPTILCTGFSELIDKEKAFTCGFQGYLMKPIMMSDLARAVRDALDTETSNK
jgi:nitrogen-specific signal transduction histidine kinase/CheY-like chemotaxis protein